MNSAEVKTAALSFLEALARKVSEHFDGFPQGIQRSVWMVPTSLTSSHSQEFERNVPARTEISIYYQSELTRSGFPEQQFLGDLLMKNGIPTNEHSYNYFLSLVNKWLDLPNPIDFGQASTSQLLDDFARAVVEGRVNSVSVDALEGVTLKAGSLELEKGVIIRPITEEELWEFGEINRYSIPWGENILPSDSWVMLEVNVEDAREAIAETHGVVSRIRDAVLTSLVLVKGGRFEVTPLGLKTNFGKNSLGRSIYGSRMSRQLGRGSTPLTIEHESFSHLVESWLKLKEILISDDHYLRLPAQRLFDGLSRMRPDDAVIDYCIGLEALLTEGVRDELRYRFSLRGATILSWDTGARKQVFNRLRDLYDVRSSIVHGGSIAPAKLREARVDGETALRDVWWWYFEQGVSLSEATSRVEARILE